LRWSRRAIFVDTSFLFAFNESEKNHGRVVEVFQELEGGNLPELGAWPGC
jgi:predicted nucleic acid-binding protein